MAHTSTASAPARRRTRGEGSLYQRPNGSWVFTLRTQTGQRKSVSAPTKRDLAPKMAELRRQVDAGVVSSTMTLTTFLDYFLDGYVAERLRPNSQDAYRTRVRFIQAHVGALRLGDVTPAHVRAIYSKQVVMGVSTATIKLTHCVLNKALTVAVNEGYIMRNACSAVEPPRPTLPGSRGTFTLAEMGALVAHVRKPTVDVEWRARILVGLLCGLRQGEVFGLTWENTHLDDGYVSVVQQRLYRKHGVWEVGPVKGRSHRVVPLLPEVEAALCELRRATPARGELVFKVRTPSSDLGRYYRTLAKAGLERRSLHACRAGCASMMAAAGVSTRVIADVLGHKDIAITDSHYIHTELSTLRRGLDAGGRLLLDAR